MMMMMMMATGWRHHLSVSNSHACVQLWPEVGGSTYDSSPKPEVSAWPRDTRSWCRHPGPMIYQRSRRYPTLNLITRAEVCCRSSYTFFSSRRVQTENVVYALVCLCLPTGLAMRFTLRDYRAMRPLSRRAIDQPPPEVCQMPTDPPNTISEIKLQT